MVWCAGARPDPVRDLAMVPGPIGLGDGGSNKWPRIDITAADVSRWPFSTGALVKTDCLFKQPHLAFYC